MSRAPASTVLWGHLLRKDTLASPSTSAPLPPTAPLDKAGTSMRILLHDTQANFEKFSARVDALACGMDETRREISIVKNLFQGEHESLTMEIMDLVNRSQTQIQKSVGQPAQADNLAGFQKEVDLRLGGLTKRLDDMQLFNQTHSQALQNLTLTLQSLQDQQGKIVSTLLPLLPLLQAVPVHIEAARNNINETLKVSLDSTRMHRTPPRIWPQTARKRSFPAGPPSSPLIARKRPRLEQEHNENEHASSPSVDGALLARGAHVSFGPSSRRPQLLSASKAPHSSLIGPGCPPFSRSSHRFSTPSLVVLHRDPSIPRRPLGDLPVPRNGGVDEDLPYSRIPNQEEQTPRPYSSPPPCETDSNVPEPRSPEPLIPPTSSKEPLPPAPATPKRAAMPVQASASFSSPPTKTPTSTFTPPDVLPTENAKAASHAVPATLPVTTANLPSPAPQHGNQDQTRNTHIFQQVAQYQPPTAPVKALTVRGRRSPFRDGRRFIPLDDDDDSDDDSD